MLTQLWKAAPSPMAILIALALTTCATTGGGRPNRPEIAFRRGPAWQTYTLEMPRITGPTADLLFKDGHLRGALAARVLDVDIRANEATGFGPGGPVNLKIAEHDGGVEINGAWNGDPVHFFFGPALIRGSVVVRGGGTAREISCGYRLDRVEAKGALVGSSGCGGMPQETRLEIEAGVRALLTPKELAVFLVAALGTPPFAPGERF